MPLLDLKDSMSELKTITVSAAIFYQDNKILAACRADKKNYGLWEFPGGKIESGETSEEALRREIQEELSCHVQAAFFYDTVHYSYPDFNLIMDCYICTFKENETPKVRPHIHSELRWLSQSELLDVPWLPADIELINQLGTFWNDIFAYQHL